MLFGLAGAPASFCRLISQAFKNKLCKKICFSYLDNIIVFSGTSEELLDRLCIVLDRLCEVGLKVKPSKCVLFKRDIQFLGHLLSVHEVDPGGGGGKCHTERESLLVELSCVYWTG